MRSALFVLALAIAAVFGANLRMTDEEAAFVNFRRIYGKNYANADEQMYRLGVFSDNYRTIQAHNKAGSSWTMGVNKFADMTLKEFLDAHANLPAKKSHKLRITHDYSIMTAAESVDWTTKGAVTPVKDQGACGSCWSFSVTGAIESAYFIKYGKLLSFSEQQMVDCASDYDCQGCSGAWMVDAFRYVVDHGLCTEEDYPYRAVENPCKDGKCTAAVKLSSYSEVPPTEVDLAKAVTKQPVAIAFDASDIMFYSGGIFSGPCTENINHAVLAVGYGVEGDKKFWKIKNSWSASWGDKGYFRIEKDTATKHGLCAIAEVTSYPNVQ